MPNVIGANSTEPAESVGELLEEAVEVVTVIRGDEHSAMGKRGHLRKPQPERRYALHTLLQETTGSIAQRIRMSRRRNRHVWRDHVSQTHPIAIRNHRVSTPWIYHLAQFIECQQDRRIHSQDRATITADCPQGSSTGQRTHQESSQIFF